MKNLDSTGERVKKRRKELNLTQEELAKKMGYQNRSSINNIEAGGRQISQKIVEKLADALDVSPAYLMCWTDDDGLDIRDTHPNDLTPRKGPSDFDKATFEASEEIHSQNAFINYINSIGYEFIEPNQIKKGSVLVEITDNELLDLEKKSSNYTDELLMELIKKKIGL